MADPKQEPPSGGERPVDPLSPKSGEQRKIEPGSPEVPLPSGERIAREAERAMDERLQNVERVAGGVAGAAPLAEQARALTEACKKRVRGAMERLREFEASLGKSEEEARSARRVIEESGALKPKSKPLTQAQLQTLTGSPESGARSAPSPSKLTSDEEIREAFWQGSGGEAAAERIAGEKRTLEAEDAFRVASVGEAGGAGEEKPVKAAAEAPPKQEALSKRPLSSYLIDWNRMHRNEPARAIAQVDFQDIALDRESIARDATPEEFADALERYFTRKTGAAASGVRDEALGIARTGPVPFEAAPARKLERAPEPEKPAEPLKKRVARYTKLSWKAFTNFERRAGGRLAAILREQREKIKQARLLKREAKREKAPIKFAKRAKKLEKQLETLAVRRQNKEREVREVNLARIARERELLAERIPRLETIREHARQFAAEVRAALSRENELRGANLRELHELAAKLGKPNLRALFEELNRAYADAGAALQGARVYLTRLDREETAIRAKLPAEPRMPEPVPAGPATAPFVAAARPETPARGAETGGESTVPETVHSPEQTLAREAPAGGAAIPKAGAAIAPEAEAAVPAAGVAPPEAARADQGVNAEAPLDSEGNESVGAETHEAELERLKETEDILRDAEASVKATLDSVVNSNTGEAEPGAALKEQPRVSYGDAIARFNAAAREADPLLTIDAEKFKTRYGIELSQAEDSKKVGDLVAQYLAESGNLDRQLATNASRAIAKGTLARKVERERGEAERVKKKIENAREQGKPPKVLERLADKLKTHQSALTSFQEQLQKLEEFEQKLDRIFRFVFGT